MRFNSIPSFFCGAALLIAAGCGDNAKTSSWEPTMENPPPARLKYLGKDTPVFSLKGDDVIVSVNGALMTRDRFDLLGKQMLWVLGHDKMMRQRDREQVYKNLMMGSIERFVETQLMLQRARSEKLATADELRQKAEEGVGNFCRRYSVKESQLAESFPGGLDEVRKDAEDAWWVNSYIVKHAIKGKPVTDEVVTNILRDIEAENAAVAATNAAIKALLERVRADIVSGAASFDEMADKHSDDEHRGPGGSWGVFRRSDLPDSDLIFDLAEGSVSDVLEDDDTYYIVRVDAKTPAQRNAEGKLVVPESVELSRIQQAKDEYTILAHVDSLKADLQRQMDDLAVKADIERLAAEADIVYPHGTNFWTKVEDKTEKVAERQEVGK